VGKWRQERPVAPHGASTAASVSSSSSKQHKYQHEQHISNPTLGWYLTPLRNGPSSAATTIHASSGLRSRTRSRSRSKEPQAKRNKHIGGVGGGSISIGIDSHRNGDIDDSEGYSGSNHGGIIGGDDNSVISSATKSSALGLKRAASSVVTLKRRTGQNGGGGGDRLPLYHPNQYRLQSYTNTRYHDQQQHHPILGWPTPLSSSLFLYVMLDSKGKVDRSTAHLEYYREEESNFYINMKDNTRIHGPLSQVNGKDDDEVDADPAFGKIVAGFDAVERLHAVSTKTGGSGWEEGRFVNTVIIRYAKILPQAEEE